MHQIHLIKCHNDFLTVFFIVKFGKAVLASVFFFNVKTGPVVDR